VRGAITLKPDGDGITAVKFKIAANNFFDLIDAVASEVTSGFGNCGRPVTWIVTVERGSAVLHGRPQYRADINSEAIDRITPAIGSGIGILVSANIRPDFFNDRALAYARTLVSLSSSKDAGLQNISIVAEDIKHTLT
jgi:hypothetical protein